MSKSKRKPQLPEASSKKVRTEPQANPHQKQVRGLDYGEETLKPIWSFVSIDIGSSWCWTKVTIEVHADILTKLGHFEGMTWTELRNAGCHSVQVNELIKAAQDRLQELGKDDLDTLYSLHITGKVRVWTIKEGNVLRLLWLDMEHEICPSHKKHT